VSPSKPTSIVRRFVECINAADIDGIAALTAPTYTFTDMEGDVYVITGKASVRASWNEYLSAHPQYRILVDRVLRSGEGVALVGRTTGSHLSPGVEESELVLWIAELQNDRICAWRIYSTLMCEA